MFGKWIGRNADKDKLNPEQLAQFGPYAELPRDALEQAAALADRIQVNPGLIGEQLPNDSDVYLHSGSLQIATRTGFVLQVNAGEPQARCPVPPLHDVASLYAAEPSTFLSLPRSVRKPPSAATVLERPELSEQESTALQEMRTYFRKEHHELPSLPDLAVKISKAIDDPNNANDDIAKLIQLDPALTARMISVVNSAAFGGINKIGSITQATARLGRNKVRSLVYSCLVKGIFRIRSAVLKRRMEALWQHSVHVAALSFILGRVTPGIDPEQALLAGLIHDIGSVAVIGGINRYPILAQRPEVLDYTLDSLRVETGMLTLEHWGLADEFGEVVRNAENWSRVGTMVPQNVDVIIIAQLHALIGRPRREELPRMDQVPAFDKLVGGGLSPRRSLNLLDEAEADIREVRSLLGAT